MSGNLKVIDLNENILVIFTSTHTDMDIEVYVVPKTWYEQEKQRFVRDDGKLLHPTEEYEDTEDAIEAFHVHIKEQEFPTVEADTWYL